MPDRAAVPETFSDYRALLSRLRVLIRNRSVRIIGIEGFKGAGKSCLAKMLGNDVNLAVLETDEYLCSVLYRDSLPYEYDKSSHYVDGLDLEVLAEKLNTQLATHGIVVVEGICLRDTLAKIQYKADLTIYVEYRIRQMHAQNIQRHMDDFKNYRKFKRADDYDQIEYQCRIKPNLTADISFIVP